MEEKEKKTSSEWMEYLKGMFPILLWDADGWDKSNFEYSFYEEGIDKDEFIKRLSYSTVKCDIEVVEYIKKWKNENNI